MILRQSPRRGCSRTSLYAPPPDGGFSLSDAKISRFSKLSALFRELHCQSHCHGAHVRPCTLRSLTVALSRTSSKYRAQRISVHAGVFEYAVSLSETELRAAKPNFHRGCFAPALESRGANLRPRKLDEKLSRNVARARRVALLAPRATLNRYRYPLSYVRARLKLFSRGVFIKARFAPL
mgnify:CR=1 FL=1